VESLPKRFWLSFEFSNTPMLLLLLLQLLSRGAAGMPTPQEEITGAREVIVVVVAAHVEAMHVARASA
jgi:hypothetical protein